MQRNEHRKSKSKQQNDRRPKRPRATDRKEQAMTYREPADGGLPFTYDMSDGL